MTLEPSLPEEASLPGTSRQQEWPWKIALVLETPQLSAEITSAMAEAGAVPAFELRATSSSFEIANAVERDKPDILFVELSRASKPPAEWMACTLPLKLPR